MSKHLMNDTLGEHISAFLDGELPKHELELLLKRLDREPRLRETLARYAAIGECLRGEPDRLSRGFAARVCTAVATEARRKRPAEPPKAAPEPQVAWMQKAGNLAGGLAIAASVATVAILVLQRQQAPNGAPEKPAGMQLVAQTPEVARTPETVVIGNARGGEMYSYTVPAPVKTSAIVPEARLTDYVFAHSEYSSPLGRRNVLSSVVAGDPTPVEPAEKSAPKQEKASSGEQP